MLARPILAVAALVLASTALGFTVAAAAQTADPAARVFHPASPIRSYDVATIKPEDPAGETAPNGMHFFRGTTIRDYIRGAYSPAGGPLPTIQVVGGPEWLDKDRYVINGKPPADLELAMQKMNLGDRAQQNRAMQQSLLADRFHLKVHFEVRGMPIYALVPAKGGLKVKAVAEDSAPSDPSSPSARNRPPPGTLGVMTGAASSMIVAHAISMAQLAGLVGSLINIQTGSGVINMADTGNRPVIDQTGFTGRFDIDNLRWSSSPPAASDASSDAPTLETAIEEILGLRLVATKGPVEVIVIDSIDHPSEN